MVTTDRDNVFYRCIRDIDVSEIAVHFEEKGYKSAASSLKDNKEFIKVLSSLSSNNKN